MVNKLFRAFLSLAVLMLAMLMPVLAFAAAGEVNPGSNIVDLSGAVPEAGGVAYLLLALAAAVLYKWLSRYAWFAALVSPADYQKLVDPLLDQAVAYGVGKLKNADWLKVDTKNQAVAGALQYAVDHGGDILKKFGITEAKLKEKIEAKLVANGWDTQPGKWKDK